MGDGEMSGVWFEENAVNLDWSSGVGEVGERIAYQGAVAQALNS